MRVTGASSPCGHSCRPKLTLGGSVDHGLGDGAGHVDPAGALRVRPRCPAFGLAEPISAALSSAGVQVGCCWARIAAAPATCGAAIDVPDERQVRLARASPRKPSLLLAATMSTPGAVMSGLSAASPTRGPRLEKSARLSDLSTAPTVSAASALPGEPTVSSAPSLPAETTNSAPNSCGELLDGGLDRVLLRACRRRRGSC